MGLKNWLADFLGKESKPISELYYEKKIPQVYYKELAIQTAISLIANAISKCEIKVFEKGEEVKNKTYFELNIQPNKNESSSQMWHKAIEKMFDNECIIVSVANELHVANSYHVDEYPILGNVYKGNEFTRKVNLREKASCISYLEMSEFSPIFFYLCLLARSKHCLLNKLIISL